MSQTETTPPSPAPRREPLSRFWALFERVDQRLKVLELIGVGMAATALGVTLAVFIGGVFTRPWTAYVFSVSLETGQFAMWPIAYLGAAYIWRIYGHVQFDLVLRRTHFRTHHVIQTINTLLSFAIGGLFAWFAWHSFYFQYTAQAVTQNLRYPHWPVFWMAFVGLGLMATELLFSLARHLREVIHPTGSEEEVYGVYAEEGPGVSAV